MLMRTGLLPRALPTGTNKQASNSAGLSASSDHDADECGDLDTASQQLRAAQVQCLGQPDCSTFESVEW